jgi:very-short-patch-repair endonuclease
MTPLIILVIIIIILAIATSFLKGGFKIEEKRKYAYKRKDFFLSRAEHEFYDALTAAIGQEYLVFAQVHLPTIVDNKIKGQNWRGAFKHINEKSVDFVLCDKAYISPKLVIELDDRTHNRLDRKERDVEVERILKDAGLPLLRINNHGQFNPVEISQKIKEIILK